MGLVENVLGGVVERALPASVGRMCEDAVEKLSLLGQAMEALGPVKRQTERDKTALVLRRSPRNRNKNPHGSHAGNSGAPSGGGARRRSRRKK